MAISVGSYLINNHIPDPYKIVPNSTSKDIQKKLEEWARHDPRSYAENITKVKQIADDIGAYEGLSLGMADLNPMIKERKVFLNKYLPLFDKAKTDTEKKQIVADALVEGANIAVTNKGSMGTMVRTGAKGNASQIMKNIFSPVSSRDIDATPYPYIIKNSFAEGLTPGEYWVNSIEARLATVEGKTHVSEPGDFGKQLFNSLNNMVISVNDCGTLNGLYFSVEDHHVLDRYLAKDIIGIAKRNTLVTDKIIQLCKKNHILEIMVRSPTTCEARNGVCQKCYGLNATGHLHPIGSNVGTLAAQSLTEPLTQMTLSTKHGVVLAGKKQEETGIVGIRKLFSKPKIFTNKAALAQIDGKVNRISPAPQGGTYVYVNDYEHYVPIGNKIVVTVGQIVTKGSSLSDGLKDPREFTNLRGLGSGRSYLTSALYNAYNPIDPYTGKRSGIDIDKRHLEVLAKKDLNHVIINEHNDTFTKNDIVEYNKLKEYLIQSRKEVPLDKALGEYLGQEYLHYTVGTEVTPNVQKVLANRGINKVFITERKINFSPYVTNIRTIPLLKENFLAKLTHSELKNSLIQAATKGETSEFKGYDPVPAFIHGVEFGEGVDGQY